MLEEKRTVKEYVLDATDRHILHQLQKDGKMKIKELAYQLKLTSTPIFDRIKRLEKHGYIEGYSARVNKEKLGFKLVAFCTVTLESHHKEYLTQFVRDIQKIPEVVECYHLAGSADYLLKVFVADMDAYQHFITQKLASLANIGKVQSSFVMTEIKNEAILPLQLKGEKAT